MKVLSVYPHHATLFALGIRTIETRSFKAPDAQIGERIALAATAAMPSGLGRLFTIGDYTVEQDNPRGTRPAYLLRGPRLAWPYRLPLGAIVCTARLAACAPMVDLQTGEPDEMHGRSPALYLEPDNRLCLSHHFEVPARHIDVSDQYPYGDFRPGRWAWILDSIERVNPVVKFKGQQGLAASWKPS